MSSIARDTLVRFLDDYLDVLRIQDDSVNGLQVEGAPEITKVALATDAALAVYRKAIAAGCEMIVTHHGLIWGGIKRVVGRDYQHLKMLLDHGINLYASHLPLDLHAGCGNNIELARMLQLREIVPFGAYHGIAIGFGGTLPVPCSLEQLAATLRAGLGGAPVCMPFGREKIARCAIVSGGGGSALGEAIAAGYDCFITGEAPHQSHHMALEAGINVLLLGHYHSETPGVRALGGMLAQRFGITPVFIDEPTTLG